MKKIIITLLLLAGCGVYDSDGIYINKNTRYVKYDTITGKHIIIKYVPIYRYSSPYYNHFYEQKLICLRNFSYKKVMLGTIFPFQVKK